MRGEVCGNLGGQQSLNGGDGAGEGAGAGWTSQTSGAEGEERRTAGGMDVNETGLEHVEGLACESKWPTGGGKGGRGPSVDKGRSSRR